MKLVRRRELAGDDLASQLRRRILDLQMEIDRLVRDRKAMEQRLKTLERAAKPTKKAGSAKKSASGVSCPRCGRARDFLTDAEGYLAHVLEDPTDIELLSDGKPLFCPACGEVFLYASGAGKPKAG